ncbi:MAG TPA: hypothetical protein VLR71_13140 [Casimicrobiaceae bacterium]|nr:hypothetical protein [Casimicrobiaceae bacterium]
MNISRAATGLVCALLVTSLAGGAGTLCAKSTDPVAPTRIRATILRVTGDNVEVTARGGKLATARLTADTSLFAVTQGTIADVKPNSFVGSAAIPQPDGTLKALEVTVFPPGLKSGEGNYPWDLGRNSQMTNGTVGSVVGTRDSTVTVKYPNGEKRIVIPADVPVVQLAMGDRSLLVPGAHVVLFVTRAPDGTQVLQRALVGKNGLVPPM